MQRDWTRSLCKEDVVIPEEKKALFFLHDVKSKNPQINNENVSLSLDV